MLHCMIDIETLGCAPESIVVTAGYCLFTDTEVLSTGGFSMAVADQLKLRRAVEPGTLAWWFGQSDPARATMAAALQDPGDLYASCAALRDAIEDADLFWAGPSCFDFAALNSLYEQADCRTAWNHRNVRDMRSYCLGAGIELPKIRRAGVYHDATADAEHQACVMIEAFRLAGLRE